MFNSRNNLSEIAESLAGERGPLIRADYVGPGLSQDEYRSYGFTDLEPSDTVVGSLNRANYIEHVDENGVSRFYKARNHKQDKYDPDNLLEAQEVTDETNVDGKTERELQREAMEKGGKYRFVHLKSDLVTRTGGAFMYFLKEDFPGSLEYLGIYKKSEWEKLCDIEVFNSCLVHCFKEHPNYERLFYSKASVYTLCSKKVFETVCDIMETNIIVHIISVNKNKTKKNGNNISKDRQYKYVGKGGKKYQETFEICLIMGHYFPFVEDTGFTTRYIKKCIWKDEEENKKKPVAKYGLYASKTSPLNSFNLVKLMIEQMEDYFEPFQSETFREPRKEKIDEKIMFKDFETFDVDFDCREWAGMVSKPDEFEEILEDEELDEEELFNNLLDNAEVSNNLFGSNKEEIEYDIYHADIETTTDGVCHKPYLMACDNNEGTDKQYFWEEDGDCIRRCLNYIAKKQSRKKNKRRKTIIKFQNLGYDINFIREKLSQIHNSIEPSKSKVYRLQGSFRTSDKKNVTLTFVDQYPQIPMRLMDYEKSFYLKKGKFSDFPHWFYNSKTVSKKYLTASNSTYNELLKIFPKEYIRESLDGKKLIIEHMKYAIDYCQQDVETQRQGWNCMWNQVMDQLGLDYNKYMTISNLSKAYCEKEGCYEGINQIRGKTALFIRKTVVGGRTMSKLHDKKHPGIWILNEREGDEFQDGFNFDYEDEEIRPEKDIGKFNFSEDGEFNVTINENYKKKPKNLGRKEIDLEINSNQEFVSPRPKLGPNDENENIVCCDENSLYPTAITQLEGYPIGKAKNIPREDLINKKFIEYSDEFYVKILIKKVNEKLYFPCLTKVGERGERLWINDMEGEEIYVDRITLEELIKHHEIEFDCKTGIMFNEGHNPKIGEVVRKLYDLRTMYKKEKNPIQLLYKLMLNTAYGKTIQKPKDSNVIWRADKTTSVKKLIKTFGESIQSITPPRDGNKIFKAKIRIGIINHWAMPHCGSLVLSQSKRIMNKFMVPYGEDIYYTDTDSIFMKEKRYLQLLESNPELFGDELGQMKEENHLKGNCVRIVKAMFMAPKVYWIKEINEKGETYDKITMKGIPQSAIDYTIKQKFEGNVEKLFYGFIKRKKGVLFDLTLGGDGIRMDFSRINEVFNLDIFSRRLGGFK